jgi:hypothetical protein
MVTDMALTLDYSQTPEAQRQYNIDGRTPYAAAVENGFVGSEGEWYLYTYGYIKFIAVAVDNETIITHNLGTTSLICHAIEGVNINPLIKFVAINEDQIKVLTPQIDDFDGYMKFNGKIKIERL